MISRFIAIVLLMNMVLDPFAAQAYLLPLIGAGGAIISMLIGVFAAVCSALFLVFYSIRRKIRRLFKKEDINSTQSKLDHKDTQ